MTYETRSTAAPASVLDLQMASPAGRDAYLDHFKSISTPGNGNQFCELASAYKSLWGRGVAFPTRAQLLAACSSWA